MLLPRSVAWMLPVGMLALGADVACAQGYPNRVVRIVTSEPGSGNDFVGRIVAQGLTASLGHQVIVDNRGSIAAEIVAKAPPDGYTLLFYGSSVWLLPFFRSMPYDPVRDLSPISTGMQQAIVLVVHPSLPVKSVKELIALAKARPGELNYSAGTIGATPHLATELFKNMAGVNIVRISYKGTGPSVTALVSGEVHLMFTGMGSVAPHIQSGRLRTLAVTTAQPSALTPGLPTVAASLPGYEFTSVVGFFAPARTPATIVNLLSQEIVRVLNRADVKERLFNSGVEGIGSSPEEFAARVKSDMVKWSKVIKDAGIRGE
jgi:tripartite-type tricarboxylate transporter receptor subunit TctC